MCNHINEHYLIDISINTWNINKHSIILHLFRIMIREDTKCQILSVNQGVFGGVLDNSPTYFSTYYHLYIYIYTYLSHPILIIIYYLRLLYTPH